MSDMELRDYFAAHAPYMATIRVKEDRERLAAMPEPDGSDIFAVLDFNARVEAAMRYIYANAMLNERSHQ
jgi:head-tail adaptor